MHVNPSQPGAGQLVGLDEPQGLVLRDRFQCWQSLKQGQQFLATGEIPARNPGGPSGRGERQARDHSRRARREDRHRRSVRGEVSVDIAEGDGAAEAR